MWCVYGEERRRERYGQTGRRVCETECVEERERGIEAKQKKLYS